MARIEDLGEVVSTDVLIVGGGFGGLAAAIRVKEEAPGLEVLLVDKQTVGWAGKAPKGGGVLWVITPEYDLDRFVEYYVRNVGDYLNDQELLESMARESSGAIERLAEWGAKVTRNAEGRLDTAELFSPEWPLTGVDLDMMFPMRARVRKLGAKIVNKVQVVELLKQGDRVVGTVGFSVLDGRFYIFKAKAIILVNGSCCYKVMRMWSSATGDGIAAAYRAGAEMRNAEFGNFFDILLKDTNSPAVGGHKYLYNGLGQNISEQYIRGPEPDIPLSIVLGMEKEVNEGRGPITCDAAEWAKMFSSLRAKWKRDHFNSFHGRTAEKILRYGPPPSARPEVTLGFHGELSPVKVDHEMKTTLEGLWAIGDTSYEGSCWAGAVFAPPGRIRGSGLMNALLSALRGGPSAARFALDAAPPEVDSGQVERMKEEIFAPMRRDKGLAPADALHAAQEVVCKVKYNLRRSKGRLEEALSRIAEVQGRFDELWAKDGHGLCSCHETRSIVLCAELTLRAALMRTESRGWHYREDYPNRDDRNWLKWVVLKQEAGKMACFTEPVPIEKYKIRPPKDSG